jgi:hypothetical protein
MHGKRIATRIALTNQLSLSTNRLSRCAEPAVPLRGTISTRGSAGRPPKSLSTKNPTTANELPPFIKVS